ncbi:MAG: aspartate/glutamate racemase family protein, partial [Candidatus Bathyarchaeia archaeon]
MAKHIGIIAVSSEGAALCYRTIIQEAFAIMGKFVHPEVSMHTHSLSRYMDCIEKDDWDGVASLMVSSAEKLAAAGAEFGICPDNTVHRSFEKVKSQSPIPLISITETV